MDRGSADRSAADGFFLFLVLLAAPLYLGEGTEARAASPRQEIERSIVREIPSKHKVRKTFYADYDRNGRPEAFVLTGPKKKKNEQAETELTLWFAYVKNGNVVSRKLRQDVLGTSGFLKLQSVTLFRAQTYCTTSGPEDLYRVTGNKVTKIFHGDLMAPWAGDSFTSVHSTYDSAYDKSAGVTLGHTWKPYYFYYKNGKIYEHNGKKITSSRFMRYKNAEKILKRYRKMGKVRSIIYRSNGLIHINFEKKYNDGDKSYSNVTLHVSGNMLKKPVVKEGIYKKKFM